MAKRHNYTQKTLKHCRELGRTCGVVERFIPQAGPFGKRIDLFGFIDIICTDKGGEMGNGRGIIAIQSTGPSGHSAHKKTILENENVPKWLEAGGKIELWSWRKLLVRRGGKARTWQPKIEHIKKL